MVANRITIGKRIPPIDWRGVPRKLQGRVSAVCRSLADCEDLVHWFGDAEFCPFQPVLLLIPGTQPVAIIGDGYATAAELRDCAVVTWERRVAQPQPDFDDLRERAGLPERAVVDQLIREAIWDRIQRHKAAPVTDPSRQPAYPNPTGRIVFPLHPGVPYEVKHE